MRRIRDPPDGPTQQGDRDRGHGHENGRRGGGIVRSLIKPLFDFHVCLGAPAIRSQCRVAPNQVLRTDFRHPVHRPTTGRASVSRADKAGDTSQQGCEERDTMRKGVHLVNYQTFRPHRQSAGSSEMTGFCQHRGRSQLTDPQTPDKRTTQCGRGGIGRHVRFRVVCPKGVKVQVLSPAPLISGKQEGRRKRPFSFPPSTGVQCPTHRTPMVPFLSEGAAYPYET
jgi:hypothetical protein